MTSVNDILAQKGECKPCEERNPPLYEDLSHVIIPSQVEPIDVHEDVIIEQSQELNQEMTTNSSMDPTVHLHVDDIQENELYQPTEAYLETCYNIGILSHDRFNDFPNFSVLKEKVRQLALRSGFRVRVNRPSSGHRRVWVCKSKENCPFSIIGNLNRRGVSLITKLAHNHMLHSYANESSTRSNMSFCEASTREMAEFVRNSELYGNVADFTKVNAQQISNIVHSKTGYHINAMRASRIKHILLDRSTEMERISPSSTPSEPSPSQGSTWKTLSESVWDGFMLVVNDPYIIESIGMNAVKELVTRFKKPMHKDTLRGIVLMSCPNPEAAPSTSTNRPNSIKFLEIYHRQEEFGFFD